MVKTTKEELLKENTILKNNIEDIKKEDQRVRTYLSIELGSGYCKKENHYDKDKRYIYNWLEIFSEVGKLLEKKRQKNIEESFDKLEEETRGSQRRLWKFLREKFPDKFKDEHCEKMHH